MVVDESTFKLYRPDTARILHEADTEQLGQLKRVQGRVVGVEEATKLIRSYQYYGVFVDGKLDSIACSYVRMRDVWAIGDVYTHPSYRNRGYSLGVASAITRDALAFGAIAMLHVEEGNKPAIRVYRRLGYSVVRRKPWIIARGPS